MWDRKTTVIDTIQVTIFLCVSYKTISNFVKNIACANVYTMYPSTLLYHPQLWNNKTVALCMWKVVSDLDPLALRGNNKFHRLVGRSQNNMSDWDYVSNRELVSVSKNYSNSSQLVGLVHNRHDNSNSIILVMINLKGCSLITSVTQSLLI